MPGVSIEEGKLRSYPLKDATAHMLGYVGFASEADVQKDADPLLELPGFQIGKSGIEEQYEGVLRGVAGKAEEEVNSTGRQVRTLNRNAGVPGSDLRMTMDAELQLFVQQRLSQERSACAIVMDAYSGAVYAACSHPAYNPNVFSQGIPIALWNELLTEAAAPLTNKVIAGQYPPGSTFKLMTGLAALHAGVTSEYRKVFCSGQIKLGNAIFHCWSHGGHGSVNIVEALQQSCDCYFYQMALDTGIDRIAEMARRFGLGAQTGIDIPGERSGLMPDQAWKRKRYKEPWQQGDSMNAGIGQGYVLATPLQLATMIARIANGGIPVKPFFVQRVEDKIITPPTPVNAMGINPAHIALLLEGASAVVNTPKGTAHGAAIKEPGYSFGGKTGTSQVRRITMEDRRRGVKTSDWSWEEQHHALFVGFAPVGNPRYVCAVVIEHGASGAAAAAPIARDILLETQKRDPGAQHGSIIKPS
jgi:penicillin-binding protein 2